MQPGMTKVLRIGRALRAALLVGASVTLLSCGRSDTASKLSSTEALAECVRVTASELDGADVFRPYGEVDNPSAVQACELAVQLNPQSASAHEHLGRAYLALAYDGEGAAAQARAMDAFSTAARLGSGYGVVKLSEAGGAGADRDRAEAFLAPLASGGDVGALVLLGELRAVESGRLRPVDEMRGDGTLEIFNRAAENGGAGLLGRWVIDAMSRGDCGRLSSMDPEAQGPARPRNENAELFCGILVTYAADAGDLLANVHLGLAHTQAALDYAEERQDVSYWRERMNQERALARERLLIVKASGDQMFGPLADRVIARLDHLEMAQDRASREFWGSVLIGGLALLAAADSGPARAADDPMAEVDRRQQKSREELRCLQAQVHASTYPGDPTVVGAMERAYAAGC